MAGLTDVDDIHLDPGRLRVMVTGHRWGCIVIARPADRDLAQGIPPATPAYIGSDSNPALDRWYAHEGVFAELGPYRIVAG